MKVKELHKAILTDVATYATLCPPHNWTMWLTFRDERVTCKNCLRIMAASNAAAAQPPSSQQSSGAASRSCPAGSR